ncbi:MULTISPECIES: tetratricopeptide repeat protein [Arthrobacter]|uniref:Tetratricopeptide repeat protein n=1 Tax=Arthrobacter jinronghuae TaxID=2964609 RepID=A0ABT1NPN9_9MICC|nr:MULTISPECIES: tetratricopeptide repeat protein [Arthrobacter]MCQ1949605.1 tetratricopeptide repeat protein [Arthrobacter jinronghuae]MCQ1952925.1 tetratricopeptide repeat protein [Arthrobacter sp. zg-Y238]MCQ1954954.1 tetratricopeptide repeat protein [Arthrobacter jinronghuae]UWX77629.1 tetratricopeptide repeat protein [Arthrobacter jinronghuae]
MSTPNHRPSPAAPSSMNLRGAVDLSALKARSTAPAAPAAPGGAAPGAAPAPSPFVVQVSEQTFPQIVQLSAEVPVVIDLYSDASPDSQQVSAILASIAVEQNGRMLLARVDAEAYPQIAQAFSAVTVPTVAAVIKGQPVPLLDRPMPEEQIRALVGELMQVAAANGVNGSLEGGTPEEAPEAPLPPLHQEAFDAINAEDYDAAAAAYRRALAEQPADAEAKAGLAQVELMARLRDADAEAVRRAGAEEPDNVQAQLAVADLDIAGGHVEDAFRRITGLIGRVHGEDRETARLRLLDLFEVVGIADPRVTKARSALARALF